MPIFFLVQEERGKQVQRKSLQKPLTVNVLRSVNHAMNVQRVEGLPMDPFQMSLKLTLLQTNGVEEIRDIRDKVKYAPSVSKYKVYIIDEVHMLSIGAFNALLKTLEEPPKHVIFILATTEPHKLPLTIISRCQRFDFKRITAQSIVNRMKLIVDETGIRV